MACFQYPNTWRPEEDASLPWSAQCQSNLQNASYRMKVWLCAALSGMSHSDMDMEQWCNDDSMENRRFSEKNLGRQ